MAYSRENLDRTGIEYDVPHEIEILSVKRMPSGPDTFDTANLKDNAF
jgi:hypothetical protein